MAFLLVWVLQSVLSQSVVVRAQVVAAGDHAGVALFVKADGALWAFSHDPVTEIMNFTRVKAVVSGGYNDMFLKEDGTAYGRGSNMYGQLGLGYVEENGTNYSVRAREFVEIMTGVKAISTSGRSTAFIKHDNTGWVTGWNAGGMMGLSMEETKSLGTCRNSWDCMIYSPVQVMQDVKAVSMGDKHTVFVKMDGTVWAAGCNTNGQQGTGSQTYSHFDEDCNYKFVEVKTITGVKAVSAADAHTLFLKEDGTAYATGSNSHGQLGIAGPRECWELLGIDEKIQKTTPVPVMRGVQAVHTTLFGSWFVRKDGTVWYSGQNVKWLNGTSSDEGDVWTPVQFLTGVQEMSVSDGHAYFVKVDGTLLCYSWPFSCGGKELLNVTDGLKRVDSPTSFPPGETSPFPPTTQSCSTTSFPPQDANAAFPKSTKNPTLIAVGAISLALVQHCV